MQHAVRSRAPSTGVARERGGQSNWASEPSVRYAGADPLAVKRRGARSGQFARLPRVEPIREGEVRPAPALEGGPPGKPHRKRIAEDRPLPACLARQHNIPRRSFHATPFVRWRRTGSHTDALRATWTCLYLASTELHPEQSKDSIEVQPRAQTLGVGPGLGPADPRSIRGPEARLDPKAPARFLLPELHLLTPTE